MIIGHERIISVLEQLLSSKSAIPHAFLFHGPEGVGKRTVASAFLEGILCGQNKFGGCAARPPKFSSEKFGAVCPACAEKARLGQSRDFKIISPDEDGIISIDSVREILVFLSRKPGISATQAVLIDQAGRLTEEAVAALLKILEEPPDNSKLVLVAERPGEIPATILSRLVPIRFSFVPENEMSVFSEQVRRIAGGRPGLAQRLSQDRGLLRRLEMLLVRARDALSADAAHKILLASELAEDSAAREFCLYYWLQILRRRFGENDSAGRRAAAGNAKLILAASLAPSGAGAGTRLVIENALLGLTKNVESRI